MTGDRAPVRRASEATSAAVAAVVAALVIAACGAPAPTSSPGPSAGRTQPPAGGVLRVGTDIADLAFFDEGLNLTREFDPQTTFRLSAFEIFRCCLLRTLMAYNGRSSSEGGAELRPDVAEQFPDVSSDGLTWTFHLTKGLMYAPPLADTEIVAADFVRAIERAVRPDPFGPPDEPHAFGPYANVLSDLIVGAEDFTFNGASRISGLETPDAHTLVIHLIRPAGDLGARLAMPAFSPLPEGVADGHDTGLGPYLVASGPYMIEGADQLDPSLPPDQQPVVSGYVPGERLTLVRNPSWRAANDALRSASSERIELTQLDEATMADALTRDAVDVTLELNLDPADVERLRADPAMADRMEILATNIADWIFLNLAAPPFDDVHIRRAVNFAINRQRIVDTMRKDAIVLHHAIPDSFENDLLRDYNPYRTERDAGSVQLAMAEVRQSAYDTNGDGICDAEACAHVAVPIRDDFPEVWVAAQHMASDFEAIGVHLDLAKVPVEDFFRSVFDPASGTPMAFTFGWGTDYLNASSWFVPLATSAAIGEDWGGNLSLIGMPSENLVEFGFDATTVPSLDQKIEACIATAGQAQYECWAEADQYLMERIAPWIPLDVRAIPNLTSSRVTEMVFDASLAAPSLGEILVAPE